MISPYTFVRRLKEEVLAHPTYGHPIMDRIREGDFSLDQIRDFSIQFYHCYGNFNQYISLLIPQIPDEAMRILMVRNLVDELGNFDQEQTHPALFRRFLRALGLAPSDWELVKPLPCVSLHVDRHTHLCSSDFLKGLATIGPGTEWAVPNWFTKVVHGLHKGLKLPDEDLAYWIIHIALDIEHASDSEIALEYYATSDENQIRLHDGAFLSLDVTKLMLDELMTEIFETS